MTQKKLSITETTKEQNNSIHKVIEHNKGGTWLIVHRITGKTDLKRLRQALLKLGDSPLSLEKIFQSRRKMAGNLLRKEHQPVWNST